MSPGDDERRPGQGQRVVEQTGQVETSVAPTADNGTRDTDGWDEVARVVRGAFVVTDEQRTWFEAGCRIGWTDGYAAAEADMQAAWSALAAKVRARAKQPTHAELCDRRGEPERAAQARANEQRVMSS